jgi:hypothetical protein
MSSGKREPAMRLFRSPPKDHPVTSMLRCMEHGDFVDAFRELKRRGRHDEIVPPPHALWRLGRWLAEKGHGKRAVVAFKLFLDLYPRHLDREKVMIDLARVLAALGRTREALALKQDAEGN